MTQEYLFNKFVTKVIEIGDSDERTFTGYITAEVIDKQGEFIFVDEMMPIMEKFMNIKPIMSEVHTNRITGEVLGYSKSTVPDFPDIPAIKIDAKIFKAEGVTLYDRVWKKIVDKEYKGLSIGGASRTQEPFIKNGRPTILLKDLELYEIAICPDPANPFAKIDWVNEFAKVDGIHNGRFEKRVTRCDNMQCLIEKGLDVDVDIDVDNKHPKQEESKKEYETITKPIRGHSWEYWDDKLKEEYPDEKTRGKVIGAMEADIYKDLLNLQTKNKLLKILQQ